MITYYRSLLTLILIGSFSVFLTYIPDSFAQQVPDGVVAEQEDENASGNEDAAPTENGKESALNLSDSVPLEDLLDNWQSVFEKLGESLGFDDSLNNQLIGTAVVLFVSFLGIFIAKKITKIIQRKSQKAKHKFRISMKKANFYYKLVYGLFIALLFLATLSSLLIIWDVSLSAWVSQEFMLNVLSNAFIAYLIIFFGSLFIEVANGLVETTFLKWGSASQSRVDTLLPIAKNSVYIVFFTMLTMMLLSEIGINVMPLLAGAGVVGFAIGFGAQTIVKDLLTGFIIIFEDLIQVGDVVSLAGKAGVVEKITIRKVQLRDLSGTVYTVPFGEITIVENLTKDYSYAMFNVGVAYREDTDNVITLLKEIDEDLRNDDEFKNIILEDIEVLGLDEFADSAIIIKARIKTLPKSRWQVYREFNRRMKISFDKNNIEIPFPHQTIYFGEDKSGQAPPLRIEKERTNSTGRSSANKSVNDEQRKKGDAQENPEHNQENTEHEEQQGEESK